MKLHDLHTGMKIKLRNGDVYDVIQDMQTEGKKHDYIFCNSCNIFTSECYNDDMIHYWYETEYKEVFDIMEVYKMKSYWDFLDTTNAHLGGLLWKREEKTVKEMTVDEISKMLGYEIKVIGNK